MTNEEKRLILEAAADILEEEEAQNESTEITEEEYREFILSEAAAIINEDATARYYTKKADEAQAYLDKINADDLPEKFLNNHPNLKEKIAAAKNVLEKYYTSKEQKEFGRQIKNQVENDITYGKRHGLSKKQRIAEAKYTLFRNQDRRTSNRDTDFYNPNEERASVIHDIINKNMKRK